MGSHRPAKQQPPQIDLTCPALTSPFKGCRPVSIPKIMQPDFNPPTTTMMSAITTAQQQIMMGSPPHRRLSHRKPATAEPVMTVRLPVSPRQGAPQSARPMATTAVVAAHDRHFEELALRYGLDELSARQLLPSRGEMEAMVPGIRPHLEYHATITNMPAIKSRPTPFLHQTVATGGDPSSGAAGTTIVVPPIHAGNKRRESVDWEILEPYANHHDGDERDFI
jgi:hypothetical protein